MAGGRLLVATLITLGCSSLAMAQEDTGTACALITDDGARLECYDLIFRKTSTAVPSNSQWDVTEEVSKIDDSKNVFMSVKSLEPNYNRFGAPETVELSIACRERKTNLWIYFGGEFMSDLDGGGEVTYRIDKSKAKKRDFSVSNDHTALGLWSGGESIAFIKELMLGEHVVIRALPMSESAVQVEFDVAGLATAIQPLRAACGW